MILEGSSRYGVDATSLCCVIDGFLSTVPDTHTVDKIRTICLEHAKLGDKGTSSKLENMFFGCSPSQVLYNLEVSLESHFNRC